MLPAAACALVAVGLTLGLTSSQGDYIKGEAWVNVPLALGFTTVAAGMWSTRPLPVGLRRLAVLYTVVGLGSSLVLPAYAWAREGLPATELVAWLSSWVWAFGAAPLLGLGLVLYPDGRLPGPRWVLAPILGVVATLGLASAVALTPGPLGDHPSVTNPVGIGREGLWSAVGSVSFLLLLVSAVLGLASLAVKYRRASPDSDLPGQVRGFAIAGLLVVVAASLPSGNGPAQSLLALTAGSALPLTVGVAVLRHRLLDQRADVEGLHRRLDSLSASRRRLVGEREEERVRLRASCTTDSARPWQRSGSGCGSWRAVPVTTPRRFMPSPMRSSARSPRSGGSARVCCRPASTSSGSRLRSPTRFRGSSASGQPSRSRPASFRPCRLRSRSQPFGSCSRRRPTPSGTRRRRRSTSRSGTTAGWSFGSRTTAAASIRRPRRVSGCAAWSSVRRKSEAG